MHYCSDEELGLSDNKEQSRFYPIFENNYGHVSFYKRKLYCIDEKMELQGDYNSDRATRVQVVFEECNNQTVVPANTCRPREEIT